MILEITRINVKPGMEAEFEAGFAKAIPIFKSAPGCRGLELRRGIEKPGSYRVFLTWDTFEDHTERFFHSQGFKDWRKLVGHCYDGPPEPEHLSLAVKGF